MRSTGESTQTIWPLPAPASQSPLLALFCSRRGSSWFDGRNPVVAMDGSMRADLIARLEEWISTADLVLALGSTLSGLYADCLAEQHGTGHLVIISLSKTPLDERAALRIYAKLDDALGRLASALRLPMPTDAEVAKASKRSAIWHEYAVWYRDVYDKQHRRESEYEIMHRAQPSNPALDELKPVKRQQGDRRRGAGN